MKKIIKSAVCVLLAAVLTFSAMPSAFAQAEINELTIISSNVAGLPIPSSFSDNGKKVPDAQRTLGKMLNESGADIICTQEDFQFHYLLAQGMTNYPYQTYTSGGIPAGDGMNVFSKYPIYNIERVAWEEFCGILTHANDGLTPKGFLKFTVDADGVLIDVYDIHMDANGSADDLVAKKAQFKQLSAYIEANSKGRPVLITGDYNCTLHTDYDADFYEIMIVENGFKDSWAEAVNDGNYLRGSDAGTLINSYYQQFNGLYWGLWDSVERLIYRDGDGAKITAEGFEYETYTNNSADRQALTDHAFSRCTLKIDKAEYVKPDLSLKTERRKPLIVRVVYFIIMIFRCLGLMIPDAIRLLKSKA